MGAIRVFRRGRTTGRDQLLELVPNRRLEYASLSGLPVREYVGEVDLEAGARRRGRLIRWHSSFCPDDARQRMDLGARYPPLPRTCRAGTRRIRVDVDVVEPGLHFADEDATAGRRLVVVGRFDRHGDGREVLRGDARPEGDAPVARAERPDRHEGARGVLQPRLVVLAGRAAAGDRCASSVMRKPASLRVMSADACAPGARPVALSWAL